MIKFTGDGPNGKMLGLGLSDGNLGKLREGKPIHISGPPMGVSHDVLIFWGKTEADMQKMLEGSMDMSEAKVGTHDEENTSAEYLQKSSFGMVEAQLGATGDFPHGKLKKDDEGGLMVAIGIEKDCVKFSFGKEVAWVALPKLQAVEFATAILNKAKELP